MTLSVSIRPAVPADIGTLALLFEALDEHHRLALPEVFRKPVGPRREPSWLDGIMAGKDCTILVAEAPDHKIVGLIVLIARSVSANGVREAKQFVEIDQLVVGAAARRLGVGRSLIDAAKRWAREHGTPKLEVSAWSFNLDTIEFYRRLGFQRTVERFAISSSDNMRMSPSRHERHFRPHPPRSALPPIASIGRVICRVAACQFRHRWPLPGEAGCVGAMPAVANALVDALSVLGVKNVAMPATPEVPWRAIHEARAKGRSREA
jgi:ribosomal protein S18 acetylase RimI-like enzyme